jgi:hypothetical protein
LKNARERMDVLAAYRQVGSYRSAAVICGTPHKTVRRIVEAHEAASVDGERVEQRKARGHNYDDVTDLVAKKVESSKVGSRPSGCCRRRARPAMPDRHATSGAWSRRRKRLWRRGSPRSPARCLDPGRHAGHRLCEWRLSGIA